MIYSFASCTLDTNCYELRRGGKVCPLEPQAVDILAYLLEHRDRVVTKRELLDQLWPNRVVGESILAQRLMTIRKAIGDDGRSQHCIKTMHGRGYRFAADVQVHGHARATAGGSSRPDHDTLPTEPISEFSTLFTRPPYFAGRSAELAQLQTSWTAAKQGDLQIGLIIGEPGIGKTSLVDAFVAGIAATDAHTVGRGQCIEQYGRGEPYLPLLEALARLVRVCVASRLISHLRHHAPSWLPHLPQNNRDANEAGIPPAHDLTPAQMLRELADALEAWTVEQPLILVLEDLHWSDPATLTWLGYMARRRGPARMLILCTYRQDEIAGPMHPLQNLLSTLPSISSYWHMTLTPLSPAQVSSYFTERYRFEVPSLVKEMIQRRTGGHPLFLVAMADELLRESGPDCDEPHALKVLEVEAVRSLIPTNLRQYIEQQVQRLPTLDRLLLESASAVGPTFAVAAVAAAVIQPVEMIEARCSALARQGRFIRPAGLERWPDSTITACYAFKHALYEEVLYGFIAECERLRLHRSIGARRERAFAEKTTKIAAELAVHFERGDDIARAVHYLGQAAENALLRSAYQETIALCRHGLDLLRSVEQTPEGSGIEIRLLTSLALALISQGQAHTEVEATYLRARTLCRELADPTSLALVLGGLFSCYIVRADFEQAAEVSEQLADLACIGTDTASRLVAECALGQTALFRGSFSTARRHLQEVIARYDPAHHHGLGVHAGVPGDLGVFCRCFDAHALWHLGYPEQAGHRISEALALADQLRHPFSRALALAYAAMLYQFRREAARTEETADAAAALCREHGFPYYLAWVTILRGWALAAQGDLAEGIAEMQAGLKAMEATGAKLRRPYYLGMLADVCMRHGESAQALTLLDEAINGAKERGERWHEAELCRLQGEVLSHSSFSIDAAAPCYEKALAVARAHQSRALELRVSTSLAHLWHKAGKHTAAFDLLEPLYDWFTEGFDTTDLQEARALLNHLGRTHPRPDAVDREQ